MLWKNLLAIALCYGLGCLVSGYYLVRWKTGKDIRTIASGSAGARNVGRLLGPWGFWTTLSADFLRGAAALLAAAVLGVSNPAKALCVLATAGGHIFPIQLGFRGGKGLGVSLGALLVFDWRVTASCFLVCAVLYFLSRRYMLSGMTTAAFVPITAFGLHLPASSIGILAGWACLILWAHRKNLSDLYQRRSGSEGEGPYGNGKNHAPNPDGRLHV
jgi:glycerol-3-phosphate acyltransferase PlsY